jgi:serine protease Do
MAKRLLIIIGAVLVVSTASLAAFAVSAANRQKQSDKQLAGLNDTITALQKDMETMRTIISADAPEQGVSDIVALINPAVVRIDVTTDSGIGVGSGFIVDISGYVVTNNHVIEDATSIKVTLSTGESFSAKIADADVDRDLAMLKMTTTRSDFPVIELGSASDAQVGNAVLIAGFPMGLELAGPATFTQGIVSAWRDIGGLDYIQTDAPINPGNSGGPVVDMHGTLIGICVAAVTNSQVTVEGLGLVIPVGDVLKFIDRGTVPCGNCHYKTTPP